MTTENDDSAARMAWLSDEEVRAAIAAAAEQGDVHTSNQRAAAAHLLTFINLAGREAGRAHLRIFDGEHFDRRTCEKEPVVCAEVRDYPALLADRDALVTGTDLRLATIAASLATGRPVDLQDALSVLLGWEPIRRVAEAVLIATGAAKQDWYTVEDAPGLPDPDKARAALAEGKH